MRNLGLGICVGVFMAVSAGSEQPTGNRQACRELAKLSLAHMAILTAEPVEAGKMAPPDEDKDPIYGQLPAFCQVTAEAHPSADSKIKIEVWLPLEGWNGRFLGVGNGGFAGSIYYGSMARAVLNGYGTAGTDTGHTGQGEEAEWALGHPEKVTDFGYRGVHEMSLTGEAIAQAFYGHAPSHRYFSSCSDGGREALMEAQRFPADYDGILAGAPAYNWTHLLSGGLGVYHALFSDPASYIPESKIHAIGTAVLAQCNPSNSQGFLDDPRTCHFDPDALLCKGAETDQCLTSPQVKSLKALYAGTHTADGRQVWPGFVPGGEEGRGGWAGWITGTAPGKSAGAAYVTGYFTDMVYSKPDLDLKTLNVDDALQAAMTNTGNKVDAVNPDLEAFRAHGGKLILYHGWNDPAISALGTIDYFNKVMATMGERKAAEFTRLFMVPGAQHCGGGPGPASFGQNGPSLNPPANDPEHNIYLALQAWVETGAAPEKVIAEHMEEEDGKPRATFSRPLCPYPQAAKDIGTGDRTSAASYVCAAQ